MVTTSVPKAPSRSRELLRILFSTRTSGLPADLCLLVVRLVLAWIFIYHGSRRLFGWFGGLGIHEYGNYFANTAHLHPGELFAVLSGVIEFGGGIALALGLFTRLAGLAIFGDMMGAIVTVTWANGINATGGTAGYELNLALGFLALVPAVFGAGRFSVDAELERRLVRADATPTAERSRGDSPAY
jgi:putative oxidoreductase